MSMNKIDVECFAAYCRGGIWHCIALREECQDCARCVFFKTKEEEEYANQCTRVRLKKIGYKGGLVSLEDEKDRAYTARPSLTINRKTEKITTWANIYGVPISTIERRVKRGATWEEALFMKKRNDRKYGGHENAID